jgi:hypothetical protein
MATAQRHYETAYYLRSAFEKLMSKRALIETWSTDVMLQMTGTRGELFMGLLSSRKTHMCVH